MNGPDTRFGVVGRALDEEREPLESEAASVGGWSARASWSRGKSQLLRAVTGGAARENATPDREPEEPAAVSPAAAPIGGIAATVVLGGLAGAVLAVATVTAVTAFRPPADPRVPPLAQQIVGLQERIDGQERSLRAVEVDVVRLIDAKTAVEDRLEKQDAKIEAGVAQIAAAESRMRLDTGPASPVFGVAVAQLAAAATSGRPFESEWVNVYTLAMGDPALRLELQRIASAAPGGVPTMVELADELRRAGEDRWVALGIAGDLIRTSAAFIEAATGLSLVGGADVQVEREILREAQARLGEGDIRGALGLVESLGPGRAERLSAWAERARRREGVERIVGSLQTTAREALRSRARPPADQPTGQGDATAPRS